MGLGNSFSAIILTDGTVRTFGYNGQGQLGVNDTTNRLTPVQVWGISSSATFVACGNSHTAIVLADGTVRTYGMNDFGQLGVNDTTSRLTPVTVLNITSATAVACGYRATIVLLADGTVRTFGRNVVGELGTNDGTSRLTPVQVWGISSSAVAVSITQYHSAVLIADGTVRTFGNNAQGQLGINTTVNSLTPVTVLGISTAISVMVGGDNTGIVLANGTIRTMGANNYGQLGNNQYSGQENAPVQVWGISSLATVISYNGYNAAVLLSNGTLWTWGKNGSGQLGVNDTTQRVTPVQVWGISSSAVAVGALVGTHCGVILADSTVRTFGRNDAGQLGVNDTTSRQTPVTVLNITTAVTPAPITFLTGATAIVVPLSSASTPVVSGYLLSTAAIITYPFIQFPALNLGPVTYPQYQLELTTDYARKLTTSTWTIGSDERLKTDIETANVDRCVEIVQNLDLKYFKWEFPDAPGGQSPTDAHSLGWIAQEFAQFFPRSVEEAPAHGIMDFKNLNSDQIIKVMWGALKKLRADLKAQKSSDSELSTAGDNASPTPE
jgi:alpha-tubulin suppressor-like RCC1 family protein